MRFSFTDDQRLFASTLRDLLTKECPAPRVRAAWEDGITHNRPVVQQKSNMAWRMPRHVKDLYGMRANPDRLTFAQWLCLFDSFTRRFGMNRAV